ncbi:unnamed protein product [Caenorhabditis nigoni]
MDKLPRLQKEYIDMIRITKETLFGAGTSSAEATRRRQEEAVVLGKTGVGTDCLWISGSTRLVKRGGGGQWNMSWGQGRAMSGQHAGKFFNL